MGLTRSFVMCVLWTWPRIYVLGSRSCHVFESWKTIVWNIIKTKLDSKELWTRYGFRVCVHCNIDLGRYDLGSVARHTLGSWTTTVWSIIQIHHSSEELCPRHGFWVYVHLGLCNIIGLPIYCNILVSNTYRNTFFSIAIRIMFYPLFPLISNLAVSSLIFLL